MSRGKAKTEIGLSSCKLSVRQAGLDLDSRVLQVGNDLIGERREGEEAVSSGKRCRWCRRQRNTFAVAHVFGGSGINSVAGIQDQLIPEPDVTGEWSQFSQFGILKLLVEARFHYFKPCFLNSTEFCPS
ncbi:hypothetical protein LOK49_LG13G02714 [Camellia lanceoleosa]|uniref:Uncharacterized protein n=1 Tax=Camellia lanceoleosa TaxID=1840588 RepID=A0ACC0FH03_9ERIC|nr:hypothetical protein LOK49_LG13G02714 [Camellia lanceoleosa]